MSLKEITKAGLLPDSPPDTLSTEATEEKDVLRALISFPVGIPGRAALRATH